MNLDFLLILDERVRQNNLGYIQDGATLKHLAMESGLVDRQDSWTVARWTGELVDLGYIKHSPPGLGDRRPVPKGGWVDSDLYRFSNYRLTAAGYEAADRESRRRREKVSDSPSDSADTGNRLAAVPTLKVSRVRADELLERQIQAGQDLAEQVPRLQSREAYDDWKLDRTRWLRFTEEVARAVFVDQTLADTIEYRGAAVAIGGMTWQQYAQNSRNDLRGELNQVVSLRDRLELATEPDGGEQRGTGVASQEIGPPAIFVVHGHDTAWREQVARFLERITERDTDVVILHERPNEGRTLIEKFETYAGRSTYAVVLATGDDLGGVRHEHPSLEPRARQNVVFEMGFFFGSLGRARVAVLHEEGIEKPTDIDGLVYIPLNHDWKILVARELNAAGIQVDLTRA